MNSQSEITGKIVQYSSGFGSVGGVAYVITALANLLTDHQVRTRLIVGDEIDNNWQYLVKLRTRGIRVDGYSRSQAQVIRAILRAIITFVTLLLAIPFAIAKRMKPIPAWKKLFSELIWHFSANHLAKAVDRCTDRNLCAAQAEGMSVLHLHYFGSARCHRVLNWARDNGVPTIIHFHMDFSPQMMRGVSYMLIFSESFALPARTKLVVLHEKIGSQLRSIWKRNPDTIEVVPNWYDREDSAIHQPAVVTEFRACIVGRLVGVKGFEDFVRALLELKNSNVEVQGTIVGDGIGRAYLEDMVSRFSLKNTINFSGAVSEDDVARIMMRSSVFILPSSQEGFPITLLKAMALGLPVIVSSGAVMESIVIEAGNGFVVHAGDIRGIADAIKRLRENADLQREMGAKGKAFQRERYSSTAVWPLFQQLYDIRN